MISCISRDGSKNFNIPTCEHMILGQLTMGARQTKNAPLPSDNCIAPLTFDFPSGDSYNRVRKERINLDWMLDAVLMGCFDFM